MRNVLKSLAASAGPQHAIRSLSAGANRKSAEPTPEQKAQAVQSCIVDREAMVKEMRSAKTMKRKWHDSNAARGPKPIKEGEEEGDDDAESSEQDSFDNQEADYQM